MQKQNKFVLPFYAKERNGALKKAGPPNKSAFLMKIAFLFLMSFSIFTAKASHLVGGEISYTKVANASNQYVIKLTLYRDCAGINLQNTATIQLTNPGSPVQNVNLPLVGVATDISLVCPGQLSNCQPGGNGAIAGVQRFIYQATVTLSGSAANPTTVVYSVCCRPNGVSTLQNPGSQNMCVTTTIPPFNAALNNNSPVFVNPPIGVFCQGQPATLALNAFDPDGDALQYFLVPGRQAVNTNCVYIGGLSGTNPVSAVSPATINIGTGVISFTPTVANQRALIAVRVDEYRNGVKIGEVFRDMEITIKNCAGNTAPVVAPIPNAVVQVGQAYCVPITVTDAQAQNLSVAATGGIVPPGTLTVLNSGPGFVNAEFCFTPSLIHAGNTFSISINANDNFCPVPAASVGSFNITVPAPCNVSVDASATPTTCGLANGTATASMTGGVIPYGFNWTGPGGFISNSQNLAGLTAGIYSITVIDGNNCVASSTVEVLNNGSTIIVNGNAADALCGQNNGSITLNTTGGVPPYMFTLNGGPAQAGNVFSNLAPATYTVVVTDANNCTNSEIYVINAAADVTPPTAICQSLTAYLDHNGNVNISAGDINNGSFDNCNSITLALSDSTFDCSDIGQNTITLTVTDAANNSASCTATVTVLDTITPDLHCMDATIYLDANGNATLAVADVLDHDHEACTMDTTYLSQYVFTCANLGANNVTVYGVDNSNNLGQCTATVTVLDTVKPVPNMDPLPIIGGECSVTLTAPTALDNCNGLVVATTSDPLVYITQGSYTVSWTYADANGNSTTQSQTVVVEDISAPVPDVAALPNVTGECSATATAPTATDNCVGSVTATTLDPTSYNAQGIYVIHWTYDDGNGNTINQNQTVVVDDVTDPTALCKDFTLNLTAGAGIVSTGDIDNGSSDNCGIASMSVSPNSFTCEDAGPQSVTLTVTDIGGNIATCTATVTVQYQPDCSITVIPANNIYTGGVPNNIYLGYGPQSAILQSNVAGGAGFTYSWAPATALNCTNCANPIFTPTVAGTTTYTLTVTNDNGCVTECEVTMCVINAAATGKGNNGKVIICHVPPGNPNNPQTLSISPNAVASHLTQHAGDQLGACGVTCGAAKEANIVEGQLLENNGFETIVYPNPTNGEFTIVINSDSKDAVTASLYDVLGKKIADLKDIVANTPYTVQQPLTSGMYFITIEHHGYSQSVRLIKLEK